MYELTDTIIALSSPGSGARAIVRISGPAAFETCRQIFSPPPCLLSKTETGASLNKPAEGRLINGSVAVDDELKVDAKLYLFAAPHSYSGDDVAEIHLYANRSVTEALLENLLARGLRPAGPGEFTARAYLNGKIDLAQAEAVNEIIVSSNAFQLAAAEKLLGGKLSEIAVKVRTEMMDWLSLIEAGLDFSAEEIEFITRREAAARLGRIKDELERLLAGSISYESVVDLPAVGIAGAPNAGKSSLLNKLLGQQRSIVSEERRTTRDVLTGLLSLAHCRCVLFDCAGLAPQPGDILDELAQQAAIEAIRNSSLVIFCVDVLKEDWSEDFAVSRLIQPKALVPLATKSDLISKEILAERLVRLNELFGVEFQAVSVKTGAGIERLRRTIDEKILEMTLGPQVAKGRRPQFSEKGQEAVALTIRHRQVVSEAIENIGEAIGELNTGNDEVASMMVRAAYQGICDIQQPARGHIDEQILERIFSRFCIGK
jgi:tRNA modification GTPase